jgi:hypothetical protein
VHELTRLFPFEQVLDQARMVIRSILPLRNQHVRAGIEDFDVLLPGPDR